MASGRCVCGYTDSIRKSRLHVLNCADYIAAFQRDPAGAADPGELHRRFVAEHGVAEQRAASRDARLAGRFEEMDRIQTQQSARWRRRRDILED